jgi:hypothetical protein
MSGVRAANKAAEKTIKFPTNSNLKPSQDLSIVFKDLYYLRQDKTGHTIFG